MLEIRPRLLGRCTILVGDFELTPSASHLFALLLAFALAPREPWTRRRLQELLFAGTDDHQASHRLRQLLYRLRGFGVVLQESATGVIRLGNPVADPLLDDTFAAEGTTPLDHPAPDPLALYAPRLPAPYLDWLEHRRDALRAQLAVRRLAELRGARERQEWSACIRLATALRHDDTTSEDVAAILAEAHAMLGRRDLAVDIIDQFVRESGVTPESLPTLRRLRARVLSTRIPRREGTLRGREECLAFLADQWTQATTGRGGRACAIFGPPGMGKTRVGESFAGTVRLGGGQVIQHRADDHVRSFPLALFSELVPDLRRRRGSIGADPSFARVLDDIAPHVVPPPAGIAPAEERREEMRRAIVDLLEAVSAEQPMLIVVDDAHLLDDASRAVIRSLADGSNAAQVLVLLLCRPRPDTHNLLSASPRFASYTLPPLGEADSRALLLELCGENRPSEEEVTWAVGQAEGNAFYLNALAQHRGARVSLQAHIGSLAQTSYFGLSDDARTVLDASLLLDTLATPARVLAVAAVGDRVVLSALRELELADLLRYEEGLFTGPHAILREVLLELMASSTKAVLHRRIAEMLSLECRDIAQAKVVGWTAVNSWLAAGDPVAAVKLALQVAQHAAAVGEPEAGAVLLSQVPRKCLSISAQRDVLDAMIVLADAGKCLSILSDCLPERAALAIASQESPAMAARLRLRTIVNAHLAGTTSDVTVASHILKDRAIAPALRADAACRLLADADLHFDRASAEEVFYTLEAEVPHTEEAATSRARALLIYHASFGCVTTARALITWLVDKHKTPSLEYDNRHAGSYASLGLIRIGLYALAVDVASARFHHSVREGHLTAAEYFGAMAAEALLCEGRFSEARNLYTEVVSAVTNAANSSDVMTGSGLPTVGIALAFLDNDCQEVERLMEATIDRSLLVTSPRLRAVFLSLRIRLNIMRGRHHDCSTDRDELESLFYRGATLGSQDPVVLALWQAYSAAGNEVGASRLLAAYLGVRREIGGPEATLWMVTQHDSAWAGRAVQREAMAKATAMATDGRSKGR